MENRMVIDEEWGELEYGVAKDSQPDWDELPGFLFDKEVENGE